MTLNLILYGIAGILTIYIIVNIAITKKVTIEIAIALLGIIVSIILAQRSTQSPPIPTPTATISSIPLVLDVRHRCGDTYTVEAGKPLNLRYGIWITKSVEIAKDNAAHLRVELMFDGQAIVGEQQPVQRITDSFPGAKCGESNYETDYGIFYVAQILPLAPGNHTMQFKYYLDARVTDGFDSDSDGKIDYYESGLLTTFDITIIAK